MCEGAEAESRRGPGRGFGVRREDTSNPSLSLKVVHFRGLRAARPSALGEGAAPGSVPSTMLASRLREGRGQPRRGLRGSGCPSKCSSPGQHLGVWRRELDPDRAQKRALRSAPLSTKLRPSGPHGPRAPSLEACFSVELGRGEPRRAQAEKPRDSHSRHPGCRETGLLAWGVPVRNWGELRPIKKIVYNICPPPPQYFFELPALPRVSAISQSAEKSPRTPLSTPGQTGDAR